MAWTKDNTSGKDGDYGGDGGVKFHTEWLPVEGPPLQLFSHLHATIDAYFLHSYEVNIYRRVDKCEERAFIVDTVARNNFWDGFKGVVC